MEKWLFEAANLLRGPVDAADFKTYIFPLLFFKRLSDVFDEEYRLALDEYGDEGSAWFRENFRFQIPPECHWKEVRSTTENVGKALNDALHCIEKANPTTLAGIFGDAQWTNKNLFPDSLLSDLIEHFSEHDLSNSAVEPDMAGQAYEYLIKKFADLSNKAAGEFYTPRAVVRLMTRILAPYEGESIYDPACGTGGMLLEAYTYVREHGGNALRMTLKGQEKNLTTSSIARMNLILHNIDDFTIIRGDTLRHPAFYSEDSLQTFDCVIANPPFSLKNWGEEVWKSDHFHRNFAGLPPASYGDYAWVQHMISSMAYPHGRMAIVLPQGALFRKSAEGKIRSKLLERDLLEGVIGLAPNLFYGTTLSACICIFRLEKDDRHRGKVVFVDASEIFRKGKNQNELLPEHVDQVFRWYDEAIEVPGAAHVATLDEIREQDHNLNISLYVAPVVEEDPITLKGALDDLLEAEVACEAAEDRLRELLRVEGLM
ncbi:MAG: class I SAM-dependent DNA methyltransferase [Methanospirillum sp.]